MDIAEALSMVKNTYSDHQTTMESVSAIMQDIAEIALKAIDVINSGGKILIFGNGGSAADAQHFAAELVVRFCIDGRQALPAIALSTDTSILTACANDLGYSKVFSRQVEALASHKDMVVGISVSGESTNVMSALAVARNKKCYTVLLTSAKKQIPIVDNIDYTLSLSSVINTARVQEAHEFILHTIAHIVETGCCFI